MVEETLREGTRVRHKVAGYEGYVEGVTRIKELFTENGQPLADSKSKQIFQYRIVLDGEALRRIAPATDIEVLEGMVDIARRNRLLKKAPTRGRQGTKNTKTPL